MAKTIDLRTLSVETLNQKVSDLFPLPDKIFEAKKERAIELENFINKNKGSYFKVVNNDATDNGIYIGTLNVCTNEFLTRTFLAEGNGYYFKDNQFVRTTSYYCHLECAKISLLNESEYQEIASKIDSILSQANIINNTLLDIYKHGKLIKISEIRKTKRPNIDNYFKINCTENFIKTNKNKTFLELYKTALSKSQIKNKEYETVYEENKKVIGKYFISKDGFGEIVQVENEESIKFICSLINIYQSAIVFRGKVEMWNDVNEITHEDFHKLINVVIKIKQLCDELKKC